MTTKCAAGIRFLILPLLVAGLSAIPTPSQENPILSPLPNHGDNTFTGSENRWQLSAKELSHQQDLISATVRNERNTYWFNKLQRYKDVEHNGLATNIPQGSTSQVDPEIPVDPSYTWVIANLSDYSVFPVSPKNKTSETDLILYTELHFDVAEVISQPAKSALQAGSRFDVDLPGGKLKLSDGQIAIFNLVPARHAVQPGHRYLMQVKLLGVGGLYSFYKYWDVTTGTAVPEQQSDLSRMQAGEAIVSGQSIGNAISSIRAKLQKASASTEN